jgi:hypothetical protein
MERTGILLKKMLKFFRYFFIIFSDRLTDLKKIRRKSNSYSRSNAGQMPVKVGQ